MKEKIYPDGVIHTYKYEYNTPSMLHAVMLTLQAEQDLAFKEIFHIISDMKNNVCGRRKKTYRYIFIISQIEIKVIRDLNGFKRHFKVDALGMNLSFPSIEMLVAGLCENIMVFYGTP